MAAISTDSRWQVLLAKEGSADLTWFYAVKTTGVYCRPSCRARLPKEENHRTFKCYTGLTPAAYAKAAARKRVARALDSCSTVTEAVYEAGFQTSAQFYQQSQDLLGMQPKQFRSGGKDLKIDYAIGTCSLGLVLVACTAIGVCAIFLGDDRDVLVSELRARFPSATMVAAGESPREATSGTTTALPDKLALVIALVDNPTLELQLPLDVRGTAFQQRVWNALRTIAPGRTASYSEIAEQLGSPRAVRAVAQACAANKLAVAIPCHRVLRSDGSLSGYRWGIERKRTLLDKERAKKQ